MKIKLALLSTILVFCFTSQSNSANVFNLTSSDLKSHEVISDKHVFNGFGCSGQNISPQLNWQNTPKGTKSFALTVYDPDAPTGSGWWHWLVLNIPANYSKLPSNFGAEEKFALKDGIVQIRNDFGFYKFGGPCPPVGDKPHRYIFTIFALKVGKIDLQENSTAAVAGFMLNQNALAKTSFEAVYGR